MTTETQPQIKEFQAETKQVLRLVIHSLYSHKEIFLRELISNARTPAKKLRFEALAKPDLLGAETLSVTLSPDPAAAPVHQGQWRRHERSRGDRQSGDHRELRHQAIPGNLSGDSAKDAQLIGQFGVGFYSAFIVADKVTVLTKRAETPRSAGTRTAKASTRSKRMPSRTAAPK